MLGVAEETVAVFVCLGGVRLEDRDDIGQASEEGLEERASEVAEVGEYLDSNEEAVNCHRVENDEEQPNDDEVADGEAPPDVPKVIIGDLSEGEIVVVAVGMIAIGMIAITIAIGMIAISVAIRGGNEGAPPSVGLDPCTLLDGAAGIALVVEVAFDFAGVVGE